MERLAHLAVPQYALLPQAGGGGGADPGALHLQQLAPAVIDLCSPAVEAGIWRGYYHMPAGAYGRIEPAGGDVSALAGGVAAPGVYLPR